MPCSDLLLSTDDFILRIQNDEIKERAETYGKFAGFHWYAPLTDYPLDDIFSYLPNNYSVICLSSQWQKDINDFFKSVEEFLPIGDLSETLIKNFTSPEEAINKVLSKNICVISEYPSSDNSTQLDFNGTKSLFAFEKRNLYQSLTNSFTAINSLIKDGKKVIISIESDKFANIFKDFASTITVQF